jgi:threonine synthase
VTASQVCERCFGPLAFDHGWPARRGSIDRRDLEAGPRSMWRYEKLLPTAARTADAVGVGWTPLVAAPALGDAVGIEDLWVKDETANPSGSFKDRVVSTALAYAAARGSTVAACASTGNLARSLALLAPTFAMRAVVLVPDALGDERVAGLRGIGATVVRVGGPYDAANRLSVEAAMDDVSGLDRWAWVNVTLRPWYVEGAATIGYEIAEQLGWRAPAHVVAPAASGSMACQVVGAVDALQVLGLVDGATETLRLSVAQPAGCAPIAVAFTAGATEVSPVRPETIAASVAMGDPPEGVDVLERTRATGGVVVSVAEDAIVPGVQLVGATTGIEVEPAGGVVAAGLSLLAARGAIDRGSGPVVAILSGGVGPRRGTARLAEAGPPPVTIAPTLRALTDALADLDEG